MKNILVSAITALVTTLLVIFISHSMCHSCKDGGECSKAKTECTKGHEGCKKSEGKSCCKKGEKCSKCGKKDCKGMCMKHEGDSTMMEDAHAEDTTAMH